MAEVVRVMTEEQIGAIAIMDDRKLAGIFTERDLLKWVVARRLDAFQDAHHRGDDPFDRCGLQIRRPWASAAAIDAIASHAPPGDRRTRPGITWAWWPSATCCTT